MGRKKKNKGDNATSNSKNYFTTETEAAIIEYLNTDDLILRNKIYREKIDYPLNKLAENVIHTYKFYYYDDRYEHFKHDIIAYLLEKLPKIDLTKGKAFSYLTRTAINYCIINNSEGYSDKINKSDLDSVDKEIDVATMDRLDAVKSDLYVFFDKYIEYWEKNMTQYFTKKQDLQIIDSILQLFKNRENMEIFNKKAFYIMLREMTDANTQQITRIISIMKDKYRELYEEYLLTDDIKM